MPTTQPAAPQPAQPTPTSPPAATDPEPNWFDTHCYHCGRTHASIATAGPTAGCICDPSA